MPKALALPSSMVITATEPSMRVLTGELSLMAAHASGVAGRSVAGAVR